ncbi:MAG: short-chain dehydrogenase [Planctomycetaceae bacterium]|jgi:NAD(P)-dependent dehydrogenase (short-subunit alcohol dehydrogenase family)|nr:short-chain dehydrogenase [Planctomycetaceae bacterium]
MSPDLFDLTGRVALVSGAASGMGKASLIALAEAGASVVLADIDDEGAQATATEIELLGSKGVPVHCDISSPEDIRAMFGRIDDEFGRIDFVANIAGEAVRKKPEDISLDEVEWTWRNLVYGRFCMCQEAGRRMLAAGKGSIVNLGSLASITAMGRGHIAYSMAMGAVVQMTRELSTEWSGRGVRVNSILPAQVLNPGLQERIDSDPRIKERFLSGIPAGRFGSPDDIKGLAVFLASDASSWITGAIIPMDGGNLAMNAGGSVGSEVFKE